MRESVAGTATEPDQAKSSERDSSECADSGSSEDTPSSTPKIGLTTAGSELMRSHIFSAAVNCPDMELEAGFAADDFFSNDRKPRAEEC